MALPATHHPDAWPAVNTHEHCGCFGACLDVIGTIDGKCVVAEIKTGASIQATHWLQLEAQLRLATKHGFGPDRGELIHLKKDGSYRRVKPPPWFGHPMTWDLVKCAARTAHWRLRHDPKAQLSEDGPHALRRADGVRIPGIGTVLRLAGLVDLRDVPADILAAASARGAMVHRYLEMLHDGHGGLEADSIAPTLRGYVASWWRWVDATGFRVESVETPLVWNCQESGAR